LYRHHRRSFCRHFIKRKPTASTFPQTWIRGFADARGGRLVIGKKHRGEPTGLKNAQKGLVDLPNKIRDLLGIVAEMDCVRPPRR